jgi:hypothetical protein
MNGSLTGTTGNTEIDGLINRILAPKIEDRLNPQGVLQDPLLQKRGVDSPEVRALILALKSGNSEAIDKATARVLLAMREDT